MLSTPDHSNNSSYKNNNDNNSSRNSFSDPPVGESSLPTKNNATDAGNSVMRNINNINNNNNNNKKKAHFADSAGQISVSTDDSDASPFNNSKRNNNNNNMSINSNIDFPTPDWNSTGPDIVRPNDYSAVMDTMEEEDDGGINGTGNSSMISGDSDGSFGSSSNGTSKTLRRARKSSLPCGLNMITMMCLLIAVPILLLVIFQGILVGDAVASQRVLSDHRSVIEDIIFIASRFQEERYLSSLYMAAPKNSTEETTRFNVLEGNRARSNARFDIMISTMQDSNLEFRNEFLDAAETQRRLLFRERQRVNDRTVTGPKMRNYLLLLVEEVYALMTWISKDKNGRALETRILLFILLRRIQNGYGLIRAVNVAVLSREPYDTENLQELAALNGAIARDKLITKLAGKEENIQAIADWETSDEYKNFESMAETIRNGNPTTWANMSVDGWIKVANALLGIMNKADERVLDVITNGDILNKIALEEGMKLLASVLACCFAALFVIYYNNKEQIRLEKALDSTAVLAAAVQRFVPKNQLRTMGVRSITQVQPGMTTEVAQTIIFSDIRGFTALSESMTRLELFDWLQNYVARMSKVVAEEKSYISTFLGDGLMIVSASPSCGLSASVKMHVAVDQLNLELISQNSSKKISIGIGVHFGVVVAGVFGDDSRLTATFVATDVNLAARLEHLTKSFGSKILASDAVIDQISSEVFAYRRVGKVQVSGSEKPLDVMDVYQADSLESKIYKSETKAQFEEAVALCETDPEAAVIAFQQLHAIAQSHGITDKAVESRLTGAQNDTIRMNSTSVTPVSQHLSILNAFRSNHSKLDNNSFSGNSFPNKPTSGGRGSRHSNNNSALLHSPKVGYTNNTNASVSGVLEFEKDGELKQQNNHRQESPRSDGFFRRSGFASASQNNSYDATGDQALPHLNLGVGGALHSASHNDLVSSPHHHHHNYHDSLNQRPSFLSEVNSSDNNNDTSPSTHIVRRNQRGDMESMDPTTSNNSNNSVFPVGNQSNNSNNSLRKNSNDNNNDNNNDHPHQHTPSKVHRGQQRQDTRSRDNNDDNEFFFMGGAAAKKAAVVNGNRDKVERDAKYQITNNINNNTRSDIVRRRASPQQQPQTSTNRDEQHQQTFSNPGRIDHTLDPSHHDGYIDHENKNNNNTDDSNVSSREEARQHGSVAVVMNHRESAIIPGAYSGGNNHNTSSGTPIPPRRTQTLQASDYE